MTPSTSSRNKALKDHALKALAVAFWLGVWEIMSHIIGQEILLVSPVRAVLTLVQLMGTRDFYIAVGTSLWHILAGFSLGLTLGSLFAAASCAARWVRILLSPAMHAIKATPVASFVIVALIFIRARNLSIFISFLMVLPVMYANVLAGIDAADVKLIEMAKVFRLSLRRRIASVYAVSVTPYFLSACALSMGLCWKAGVAAEVIAVARPSIGAQLYLAKLNFDTADIFAWTLAVALMSLLFEKLGMILTGALKRRFEGA